MKNRSVAAVVILTIITFGIYGLVWHVKTKNEMNMQGADIPTAWYLLVPILNIVWAWRWCGGVDKVTNGKISAVSALLLLMLLTLIGQAIIQDAFNKVSTQPVLIPMARVA